MVRGGYDLLAVCGRMTPEDQMLYLPLIEKEIEKNQRLIEEFKKALLPPKKYKKVDPNNSNYYERRQMELHGNVVVQYEPLVDYDGDYDQIAHGNCIEDRERDDILLEEE